MTTNPEAQPSIPETTIGPDRGTFRSLPLTIVALLLMWGLWSTYKIALIRGLDRFDRRSEVGFFWSESATHYRYYRLIGDPRISWNSIGDTLRRDVRVQWPEGVEVATHFPFGMELFYGVLHRWLAPSATPHVFLLYAVSIFTGLSVVLVFLLARKLTGSNIWSLGAAALYTVSTPSFERTARGGFLYEDFALPFLIGSVALLLPSQRRIRRPLEIPLGVGTGLLAGLAASLWHVSQYPLGLIFIFLSMRAVVTDEAEERRRFPLGVLIGFGVASLALPMLRNNVFLLSLPMACLVHWAAWTLIARRRARVAVMATAWSLSLLGVILVFRTVNPAGASYSHVFEYMLARVTHPFGVPPDPNAISFAARTLWEYSFMSPGAKEFVSDFRFGLLFLPFMMPPLLVRKQWRDGLAPLCGTALALLVLGLMMRRFLVLAMPFLAVASIAGFAEFWIALPSLAPNSPWRARRPRAWPVIALMVILGTMATVPRHATELERPPVVEIQSLCDWLKAGTHADDAFFAPISMSAVILLHSDRPSLVHPIWEWPSSRDKYEELLKAAYCDEESFWSALRKYNAAYVIYDFTFALPEGGGTLRYVAGKTGPLDSAWTVAQCQFEPERLRYLDLVWQNGVFRVFKVRDSATVDSAERRAQIAQVSDDEYNPLFDARNFEKSGGAYINTPASFERVLRSNHLYNQGAAVLNLKDPAKAQEAFRKSVRECPNQLNAHLDLAFIAHMQKREDLELQALAEARRIAPLNREVARLMKHLQVNPPAKP